MNPLQSTSGRRPTTPSWPSSTPRARLWCTPRTLAAAGTDVGYGIAVDSSGNAYVTRRNRVNRLSHDESLAAATYGGSGDVFVAKIKPSGSALVYSTYLGGSEDDVGMGIAVDSSGNAYVTGNTNSSNFPTTAGAFQTSLAGPEATNAFLTALAPSGSATVYSTYLGGSVSDFGYGIALDTLGNAYLTGWTFSNNFPTTAGAFQTAFGGASDVSRCQVRKYTTGASRQFGECREGPYLHRNSQSRPGPIPSCTTQRSAGRLGLRPCHGRSPGPVGIYRTGSISAYFPGADCH